MDYLELEKNVEAFVRQNYAASIDHQYPYHNLEHTVDVVGHAEEIVSFYQLEPAEGFVVRVAAWFHDIGHLFGLLEGHEEKGVSVMEEYMEQFKMGKELILSIANCILATKFPSYPVSLCEEILCDADTFHFGTDHFRQTDPKVKEEVELRTGRLFPEWHKKSIWLLEQHHFFTSYCQQLLDAGKQENLRWLRSLAD
jgi:predicted metal-dependent HD superfamily phosphohydrolase